MDAANKILTNTERAKDAANNILTDTERAKLAEDILLRAQNQDYPDYAGLSVDDLIEYRQVTKKFLDVLIETLITESGTRQLVDFLRADLVRINNEVNRRVGAPSLNE